MKTATWFLAIALVLAAASPARGDDPGRIVGEWRGSLNVGSTQIPLVVHIALIGDALGVAMDSPDQGAFGLEGSDAAFENATFSFRVTAVGGLYQGRLTPEGKLAGTWSQGGSALPLVLERAEGEIPGAERPQQPRPPFPYRMEEVTFAHGNVTLAGTLTIPEGPGPFPAVVLVSGSGPQDRDETIFGHKPFLVLADHLTRAGVAVLRYDDRGVGASGGDFASATTPDFAEDALTAVRWLGVNKEIDHEAMGIVGHSEGGIVGPMVAAQSLQVKFLVLLAGPTVPGMQLLIEQTRLVAASAGLDPSLVEKVITANTDLYGIAASDVPPPELKPQLKAALARARKDLGPAAASVGLGEANDEAQMAQLSSPWFRWFLRHDPGPVLADLKIPVLGIYGGKDIQVPAPSNTEALRANRPDADILVFDGLNHLMQHAETGAIGEYGTIEETMSPEVLEKITTWILNRTGER